MILFHDTASIISLYSILNTGMIKSPSALKITSSSHDRDFIFLAPASDDYVFNIPSQVLVLDFDAVVDKYKKFFINASNAYGPIDGTQMSDKNCNCYATYYSDELLKTNKNKLSSGEKPCLVNSLNKMIDNYVLTTPQNDKGYYYNQKCEGGPEVGFYEDEIELFGCLRYVRLKHITDYKTYNKQVAELFNMSIEELYEKIINKAHELGAEVVIYEPSVSKPIKGGKTVKKRRAKRIKNKKSNKVFN